MRKRFIGIAELKEILAAEQISEYRYNICESAKVNFVDGFTIKEFLSRYSISYIEDGKSYWVGEFADEDDACRFFLYLMADSGVEPNEIGLFKYIMAEDFEVLIKEALERRNDDF